MLYDFHQHQNGQSAASIHATYLVYGTKASDESGVNCDFEMTSSMPESENPADEVKTTTLTLVAEDRLQGNC